MEEIQIVGKRIQDLRESKQISREELAQNSGLSLGQIICIEENTVLPAVAHLLKIARALGVRLGTFLDDQDESPVVCRETESNHAISFTSASSDDRKSMDYRALSSAKTNRCMEPYMISISPETKKNSKSSSHEGEEFLYVMNGEIALDYGNETYSLKEGDTIYFDSVVPHLIYTNSSEAAKILAVVYTPL